MPSTRELRRKIQSVRSTGKLTRAMQMVAASKMAKATSAAGASRTYAAAAWTVIGDLVARSGGSHPLFAAHERGKRAVIVLASNRGLAGSFNTQVFRVAVSALGDDVEVITVGRKALQYFRRFHADHLVADFPASDSTPHTTDAQAIASLVTKQFLAGQYRQVDVARNAFVSTLVQKPVIDRLLPIQPDQGELAPPKPASAGEVGEFVIEPNPAEVLDALAKRIVPLRLYQMLLESSAAEHSARMVAMKSATDNAQEIAADLTLTYQSIRQANITREIIEVASGASALAQ